MIKQAFRVETQWRPELQCTDLYVLAEDVRPNSDPLEVVAGATFIAKPMEFESIPRHGSASGPTLQLERDAARNFMQAMMDAAWNMGLRPSGVKDLESTLEATRFHLEDMRLLAKVRKSE